jgi:hypothetical protein
MPHENDIESTLIWYRHGDNNGNWEPWVHRLEKFLEASSLHSGLKFLLLTE